MAVAVILAGPPNPVALMLALGGVWAMGWHMHWQLRRLRLDDTARLLHLFRSNRDAGLLPVLFFAGALLV
jgi:4-hydroxybenzoate polyprenyltransferase